MLIFLYGTDSYRLKQNVEKIVAEYRRKYASGVGFLRLDLAESAGDLKKLEDTIKTVSFFNEKRLIAAKNAFADSTKISGIIEDWKLVEDKQNILVLIENLSAAELAKKDRKLFALLTTKSSISKSSAPLKGKQLENWIGKEVAALGAKIDQRALKKLVEYAGPDSWRLRQELEKLANYCQDEVIDEKAVEFLVTPLMGLNIFETIDALGAKNKAKALVLLARHLEAGDDPYRLFSMFIYQFRNLLRVKSLIERYLPSEGIAKKTGLHPYVVRKMSEQARKFQIEELQQKFSSLAQSDIQIKNGQLDIVDCLYQTVLN